MAPFQSFDDKQFVQVAQDKQGALEDIAQRFYTGVTDEEDSLLAMNLYAMVSHRALSLPKQPVTASKQDYLLPALSAYGIYGLARKLGNAYYSDNQSLRTYMDANFSFRPFNTSKQSKIEIHDPSELPGKLLPYAVENDIWCILLGNQKLYEKNRNYPLEPLWQHMKPLILALKKHGRPDLLEGFQAALSELRSSTTLRGMADDLEEKRFKTVPRDRSSRITTEEEELFSAIQSLFEQSDDGPAAKRQRVEDGDQRSGSKSAANEQSSEDDENEDEDEDEDEDEGDRADAGSSY